MKYSFLWPYYKRSECFSSLLSFEHWYGNRTDDFEIIIVADQKNDSVDRHILDNYMKRFNKFNIKLTNNNILSYNSCHAYNLCKAISSGEILIITNPECFHDVDILSGLDEEFNKSMNNYIICSNKSCYINPLSRFEDFTTNIEFLMWYQHSNFNNRKLHFCTAISRSNFDLIGGFDERYLDGIGYEDDDWLHRVIQSGIQLINRDDLITTHIEHSRQYLDENQHLLQKNQNLFLSIWK